jgi:hypothetical protein
VIPKIRREVADEWPLSRRTTWDARASQPFSDEGRLTCWTPAILHRDRPPYGNGIALAYCEDSASKVNSSLRVM